MPNLSKDKNFLLAASIAAPFLLQYLHAYKLIS